MAVASASARGARGQVIVIVMPRMSAIRHFSFFLLLILPCSVFAMQAKKTQAESVFVSPAPTNASTNGSATGSLSHSIMEATTLAMMPRHTLAVVDRLTEEIRTQTKRNPLPVLQEDCTESILSHGPWVTFDCFKQARLWRAGVALLASAADGELPTDEIQEYMHHVGLHDVLAVCIFCTGVAFAIWSLKDVHRFVMLLAQQAWERRQRDEARKQAGLSGSPAPSEAGDCSPPEQWRAIAIIGLTCYRFYTGFLSATWLPYLLAMEGQDLWPEQQSIFMGLAKLIYGATILLNPVFGSVGDRAVSLSHGVGRRLFVRIGITFAALGIYICVLSARNKLFMSFLSGVLVWRLGEALNDVTTEALVPEMVPQEQYPLASSIKSSSFLLGGLFGYVLLLVYADVHYSWLYYAYPIGMFICALPALYLLDKDHPFAPSQRAAKEEQDDKGDEDSFWRSLVNAYSTPLHYEGGFPLACLAVFVFGLGTSPMFFLLLIVRDLVGIREPVAMQEHFSIGSIFFFLSAAVASVFIGQVRKKNEAERQRILEEKRHTADADQPAMITRTRSERHWATTAVLQERGQYLRRAICAIGLIVLMLPLLGVLQAQLARDRAFYIMTVLFGFSFGVCFSLFQDLTWQMLPPEVNFATAMGFNVMCRLAGVGLGNFICGLILDFAILSTPDGQVIYSIGGYIGMCTFSGVSVLLSALVSGRSIEVAQEKGRQDLMAECGNKP